MRANGFRAFQNRDGHESKLKVESCHSSCFCFFSSNIHLHKGSTTNNPQKTPQKTIKKLIKNSPTKNQTTSILLFISRLQVASVRACSSRRNCRPKAPGGLQNEKRQKRDQGGWVDFFFHLPKCFFLYQSFFKKKYLVCFDPQPHISQAHSSGFPLRRMSLGLSITGGVELHRAPFAGHCFLGLIRKVMVDWEDWSGFAFLKS